MTSSVHSFSNKRESKQKGNIKSGTEMLGSLLEPVVLYWSMSPHGVPAPAASHRATPGHTRPAAHC